MVSYSELEQVLLESGLWTGKRRYSHGFYLSPDVLTLTVQQEKNLENIGAAISESMYGLSRMAAFAADPKRAKGLTWQMLHRVFGAGVPRLYREIQVHQPNQIPASVKVDFLIEDSPDRTLKIVEIDAHNKHGLGYSVICRQLAKLIAPQAPAYYGVAKHFQGFLGLGWSFTKREELVFLYADQERFYLPEFLIFKNALLELGIEMTVINEVDVTAEVLDTWHDGRFRVFVDLPHMYKRSNVGKALAELYVEGMINFIIPPKPFLGSKAMLAFLTNSENNPELEEILVEFILPKYLAVLRAHLPPTYLVRNHDRSWLPPDLHEARYVLKEAVSSGSKGVHFSTDPGFERALKAASQVRYGHVLQKEVVSAQLPFRYYDQGELVSDDWMVRLTGIFARNVVADVDVTARRDKRVHGAKDCIQTGAVCTPQYEYALDH